MNSRPRRLSSAEIFRMHAIVNSVLRAWTRQQCGRLSLDVFPVLHSSVLTDDTAATELVHGCRHGLRRSRCVGIFNARSPETGAMDRFLFPKWVNKLVLLIGGCAAGGGLYAVQKQKLFVFAGNEKGVLCVKCGVVCQVWGCVSSVGRMRHTAGYSLWTRCRTAWGV